MRVQRINAISETRRESIKVNTVPQQCLDSMLLDR